MPQGTSESSHATSSAAPTEVREEPVTQVSPLQHSNTTPLEPDQVPEETHNTPSVDANQGGRGGKACMRPTRFMRPREGAVDDLKRALQDPVEASLRFQRYWVARWEKRHAHSCRAKNNIPRPTAVVLLHSLDVMDHHIVMSLPVGWRRTSCVVQVRSDCACWGGQVAACCPAVPQRGGIICLLSRMRTRLKRVIALRLCCLMTILLLSRGAAFVFSWKPPVLWLCTEEHHTPLQHQTCCNQYRP